MALSNLDQLKEDEQLRQRALDREMALVAWNLDRLGLMEKIEEGKAESMAEGMAKGKAEGMAEGMAKGMTRGMAKGKAEGMAEGQLAIAKRLLEKGYTIPEISELTGLSVADLSQLKQ